MMYTCEPAPVHHCGRPTGKRARRAEREAIHDASFTSLETFNCMGDFMSGVGHY